MNIFTALKLLFISSLLKIFSIIKKIPGNDIDTFIRKFALKKFKKLGLKRSYVILTNPISLTRYWEFNFVKKNLLPQGKLKILDVSSPFFLGLFLSAKYKNVEYDMINPDKNDVKETEIYFKAIDNLNNFSVKSGNALSLNYENGIFDTVISVSVIEHIEGTGDKKAIQEMWRVIKPGGKLIITTNVMKKGRTEYRQQDQYSLGLKAHNGKYFFQRIYSENQLNKNIIHFLGVLPESYEIFGEVKKGWFDNYINQWSKLPIKESLKNTVYDPWYILTKFKTFNFIKELPGVGVIGLVFRKPF